MTIKDAVQYYKDNIDKYWDDEKYKWVAVKHFQEKWDADSDDFAGMLEDSLSLADNLLGGGMYYPKRMICELAKMDPEKVRRLFKMLYNESAPLVERLQPFRDGCDELLDVFRKNGHEKAMNHYQDLRALCVYLTFRYPEKYFLYKYKMYVAFKKQVGYQESSQEKDSEIRKYDNYTILCNQIIDEIKNDQELLQMQQMRESSDDYYKDEALHMLAQTIIYVCPDGDKDYGVEISTGETAIPSNDEDFVKYWIYSPGNNASMWDECVTKGIMVLGWDDLGDLGLYKSRDDMRQAMKDKFDPSKSYMNSSLATWEFANDMRIGDVVFAKKGMHLVVGRGVVESDYIWDPSRNEYKNVRKVKWTHKGEWKHPGQAVMKTLTEITAYTDYVGKLNALFENELVEDDEEKEIEYLPYDAEDFLNDVFMDEDSYITLTSLVRNKKNVILQGAPGVGKTFAAKRLAYSMMGVKDSSRVMMVQFHQSYSYEDFIMGFRPSETGFELKKGAFYSFCKKAEIDSDNEYFFIIDEINRGNLSKIFGELFMLIEKDKRGAELQLLYSDEKFRVPENVFIIGMMNTADRSLAMLDYALRRRFAFYEMGPGFGTTGFRTYRDKLNSDKFNSLINCVENLNEAIVRDESLGEGFRIGHSYFCNLNEASEQSLIEIVEYELIPLLKEYWFDEPTKVKEWSGNLRSAIK